MSGTGNRRVPATHTGTGWKTIRTRYSVSGYGFLAGVFYPNGYEYGQAIPSGYVPVAISITLCIYTCNHINLVLYDVLIN
jgi:hypothetical protein